MQLSGKALRSILSIRQKKKKKANELILDARDVFKEYHRIYFVGDRVNVLGEL